MIDRSSEADLFIALQKGAPKRRELVTPKDRALSTGFTPFSAARELVRRVVERNVPDSRRAR